jgi:hypothetical protein
MVRIDWPARSNPEPNSRRSPDRHAVVTPRRRGRLDYPLAASG